MQDRVRIPSVETRIEASTTYHGKQIVDSKSHIQLEQPDASVQELAQPNRWNIERMETSTTTHPDVQAL